MDVAGLFQLYREFGDADYIGEAVSQTQHMVQCALLAEKEGFPNKNYLFMLIPHRSKRRMVATTSRVPNVRYIYL
jgi:predicted HD phosphohydrolase